MKTSTQPPSGQQPWNKGRLVGQKAPLWLRDIWTVCVRLRLRHAIRELALFDLAIDSKLRACDLVKLQVRDVAHGDPVAQRAIVLQQKTQRPVQFEITEQTRAAISVWIAHARIIDQWIVDIALDVAAYGTHTMRRTNATLIYRRTKILRAVQLLLGHSKLESTCAISASKLMMRSKCPSRPKCSDCCRQRPLDPVAVRP